MDYQKKWVSVSVILGTLTAILVYNVYFQRNFISKTYLLITLGILLIGSILYSLSTRFLVEPCRSSQKSSTFRLLCLSALTLSFLLSFSFTFPPMFALLPEQHIQIRVPAQDLSDGHTILFESMENSLGYIHHSNLDLEGDWTELEDAIRIDAAQGFSAEWKGKPGEFIEIIFQPTTFAATAEIIINGESSQVDLYNPNSPFAVAFHREFPIPLISLIPTYIAFFAVIGFIFLSSWCLLALLPKGQKKENTGNNHWYFYAIPSLIVWSFFLLIFWPGMMSADSINQWRQALTGEMTNWHPIFLTFLISLLIKLWYSPAAIVIAQILCLGFTFAYGMGILQKYGVSRKILWGISILFALFPVNALFSITLWKDIAYSTALFGLFLVMLEIALSKGIWLNQDKNWLILGMVCFLTASMRPNGTIVALVLLLFLLWVIKKQRRKVLLSLVFALLAWLGVTKLLNWRYNPEPDQSSQVNLIMLSHMNAHIAAGTGLTSSEFEYLDSLLPISDWKYNCCYIGNLSYNPDFDRRTFLGNFSSNSSLTFNFFLRDPQIDIRHQICASESIWRIAGNRCIFKSLHAFDNYSAGKERWIFLNNLDLKEHSIFPNLIPGIMCALDTLGFFSEQPALFLRPAFFLYLSIFLVTSLCINHQDTGLFALLIPILAQTLILAIIIFAPSYRYQYGLCLIAIFSLGLPFIPPVKRS